MKIFEFTHTVAGGMREFLSHLPRHQGAGYKAMSWTKNQLAGITAISRRDLYVLAKIWLPLLAILIAVHTALFSYVVIMKLPAAGSIEPHSFFELTQLMIKAFGSFLASPSRFHVLIGALAIGSLYFLLRKLQRTTTNRSILRASAFAIVAFTLIVSASIAIAAPVTTTFAQREVSEFIESLNKGELGSYGILTDGKDIKAELDSNEAFPHIVGDDAQASRLIAETVLQHSEQRSQFYDAHILPRELRNSSRKLELNQDIYYLPDHTLVVRKINKDAFNFIVPTLSKRLVQDHFDSRYIKEEPDFEVVSKQEYISYRDKQIEEQLERVEAYEERMKKAASQARSAIAYARQQLEGSEQTIERAREYRDTAYTQCKNETRTYYGLYYNYTYRVNSDAECRREREEWNSAIASYEEEIRNWQSRLQSNRQLLARINDELELARTARAMVESAKNSVPYELGIFESPDSIKVALEYIDTESLDQFLATSAHEYLHYTSYISGDDDRTLPRFFEEGLTEYFARRAVKNHLNFEDDVGYPIVVRIINVLADDLGDEELRRIYFNKSEAELAAALEEQYGEDFYENNQLNFFAVVWSSPDKSVEYANKLMEAMDKEKFRKEEILEQYKKEDD